MATLTIKNLPDEIYAELSKKAKQNRRSLNGEAIIGLEDSLRIAKPNKELQLQRINDLRESLPKDVWLTDELLAESRAELIRRSAWILEDHQPKKTARRKKKSKGSK